MFNPPTATPPALIPPAEYRRVPSGLTAISSGNGVPTDSASICVNTPLGATENAYTRCPVPESLA